MIKQPALKSFSWRNAFAVGIAVFIATFVNNYHSFTHACWILLTAYIVGQTTRGTPIRQSHFRFLGIVTAVFVSSLLMTVITRQSWYYGMIGFVFVIGAQTLFLTRQLEFPLEKAVIFFLFGVLFGTLAPEKFPIYQRLIDVLLGFVIGLSCSLLVVPFRLEQEFCEGVVAVLHALNEYSSHLRKRIELFSENTAAAKSDADLSLLLKRQAGYPEWVFEVGFNPGLRGGFRFFLVNLDRVTELFMSIDYHVSQASPALLQQISVSMNDAVKKNQELLEIMQKYFAENHLQQSASDYTSDIVELEKRLNSIVPANIELLDISADNLYLTAIVRDIKDLRGILLQLITSLPSKTSH